MGDWRKSSYSNANGGNCLECRAGSATGVVMVRDTTNRDGYSLPVPAEAWASFTASLR
jgi:Domain of unknown function (DUF397)